ncbi:uncharacterized protein [Dermacentor albipictus]|uniref:uncharacterized protein isoform X1 n=1 Tax=Dermacentor albipictus TaxID=60249 RepID=UPI0031FCFAEE
MKWMPSTALGCFAAFMFPSTLFYAAHGAVFHIKTEVRGEQCIWKKYAIPDGAHINLANPCMSLTCDSRLKYLRGASCGRVSLQGYPKNCTLKKGKGIYPKCCKTHLVCT